MYIYNPITDAPYHFPMQGKHVSDSLGANVSEGKMITTGFHLNKARTFLAEISSGMMPLALAARPSGAATIPIQTVRVAAKAPARAHPDPTVTPPAPRPGLFDGLD